MKGPETLWECAQATSDDALARLAVINLVHEARGLDTAEGTILVGVRCWGKVSACVCHVRRVGCCRKVCVALGVRDEGRLVTAEGTMLVGGHICWGVCEHVFGVRDSIHPCPQSINQPMNHAITHTRITLTAAGAGGRPSVSGDAKTQCGGGGGACGEGAEVVRVAQGDWM